MIWTLLIIFQLKHYIADYLLQGKYMLGKFREYPFYIKPLLAHVSVHGAMTLAICLFIKPELAIVLMLFDMSAHFIMDRVKASPDLLGKYKALSANEMCEILSKGKSKYETLDAYYDDVRKDNYKKRSNVLFWWSLGLDQMVHHLTHYFIIYMLL